MHVENKYVIEHLFFGTLSVSLSLSYEGNDGLHHITPNHKDKCTVRECAVIAIKPTNHRPRVNKKPKTHQKSAVRK